MLRFEDCEHGSLRCRGRTDKLCVGEMLWVMLECHCRTDKLCVGEILWGVLPGRLLQFRIILSIRLH